MNFINEVVESIKAHEGFSPTVYKCPAGYDTIGYGTRIKYLNVTEKQGARFVKVDCKDLDFILINKYSWYLTSPYEVKKIIIEMVYQLGLSSFNKFRKTIKLLSNRDYIGASIEMLDSKWARDDTPERAKGLSDKLGAVDA